MKDLGSRLLELRNRAQLTRAELAELAGLHLSHVGLIETGKRKSPQASTLSPIARVLGTDVDFLLSGLGDAPSDRTIRRAVSQARAVLSGGNAQKPTGS